MKVTRRTILRRAAHAIAIAVAVRIVPFELQSVRMVEPASTQTSPARAAMPPPPTPRVAPRFPALARIPEEFETLAEWENAIPADDRDLYGADLNGRVALADWKAKGARMLTSTRRGFWTGPTPVERVRRLCSS